MLYGEGFAEMQAAWDRLNYLEFAIELCHGEVEVTFIETVFNLKETQRKEDEQRN